MVVEKKSAKHKFIETALELFARRGFYGVSLADVAQELSLTKQSIIYHFKTKEALYAAVLEGLSDRFEHILDQVLVADGSGEDKWQLLIDALFAHMEKMPADSRLIMRELLDNNERAAGSKHWYLRRFLDESVALIGETERWRGRPVSEQTAAVYQAIGAINYLAISGATLEAIWDMDRFSGMKAVYRDVLLSGMNR